MAIETATTAAFLRTIRSYIEPYRSVCLILI